MVKAEIATRKTADPAGVLTGAHFFDGDHAVCEGALAAGCRFIAGYPITPSTEIVERFSQRVPQVGGVFIQLEDELASSIAIQGAVWGGAKAMTVTSGPGFSLMMEHIGYAAISETPVVFVDVQRGGPSTGLPTLPAQADIMQCRWGSHGDYEVIALSPSSPQECFDMTIEAFNLAERWRCPVFLMMDEVVGHMTERVVIPKAEDIKLYPRRYTKKKPGEYFPYEAAENDAPDMIKAGDGYNIHVTGLTHDHRGYPIITPEVQDKMMKRLVNKIRNNVAEIAMYEEVGVDGADVVMLSFGITSRVAVRAAEMAQKAGMRVGRLTLKTIWPFPEQRVREIAGKVEAIVVPELNLGQMVLEVERVAAGKCRVLGVPHAGGSVHKPESIFEALKESLK